MRSASNPGGLGHEWVRARFVDTCAASERVFVPARLADNPFLDQVQYRESLAELDPVTRAQLLAGDWQVRPEGVMFKRDWFAIAEHGPAREPCFLERLHSSKERRQRCRSTRASSQTGPDAS